MSKEDKKKGGGGKVASDPRFAAVHYDPRFQRFPKKKNKVEVDERFAGMFNDPSFAVRSTVDKRGRKVKASKKGEDMKRYYRLRQEEEVEWQRQVKGGEGQVEREEPQGEEEADLPDDKAAAVAAPASDEEAAEEESEEESEEEEESDVDSDERRAKERWARARGLAGPDTSDDESSPAPSDLEGASASDVDSDVEPGARGRRPTAAEVEAEEAEAEAREQAMMREWGPGALAANPREEVLMLPDATARLACVDLDWENLRAVDIFAALRSFLPPGGSIRNVTVYPSDYGLEKMAEEAAAGPQAIFARKSGSAAAAGDTSGISGDESELEEASEGGAESDSELSEREEEKEGEGGSDVDRHSDSLLSDDSSSDEDSSGDDSSSDDEDGVEVDPERLRLYERSKLRWYYAVVECDSAGTASRLYDECDGMELMKTSCKFDLRFVPDEQSFQGRKVRDVATSVPDAYEPPSFQSKALQLTNVELTWDRGDEGRKRVLMRRMNEDQIKEDDFAAYLAADSEGASSDEERYASAVENGAEGDEGGSAGEEGGAADGPHKSEAAAIRERYRRLLLGGGDERAGGKDWGNQGTGQGKSKGSKGEAGSSADEGSGEESSGGEDSAGRGGGRERAGDVDMEVTFVPGLEGLGERLLAKKKDAKAKAGETVWDAYLRRKREKKAAAKRQGRTNVDSDDDDASDPELGSSDSEDEAPGGTADDPFFQREADPFDDPFFHGGDVAGAAGGSDGERAARRGQGGKDGKKEKKGKGGKGGKGEDSAEEQRRKAELEMLLLDEDALLNRKGAAGGAGAAAAAAAGAGTGKVSKKERMRLKKAAKLQERQGGSDDEDREGASGAGFAVNMEDPRFKDLLLAPDFALDPTDPRFAKAGPSAAKIAGDVARRRAQGAAAPEQWRGGKAAGARAGGAATGEADLRWQVASLKRKAAQAQADAGRGAAEAGGTKKRAKGARR